MKIVVMNREDVEHGAVMDLQQQGSDSVAVVSIVDKVAARDAWVLCRQGTQVERFRFEDDDIGSHCITHEDADRAVQFLHDAVGNKTDIIVIHCEAGISRSAGMAAAFACILGQDDEKFWHPPFCPNVRVFREVVKAWFRS